MINSYIQAFVLFGYFPLQVHFCNIAKQEWHRVIKHNEIESEKSEIYDESARSVQKSNSKMTVAEL